MSSLQKQKAILFFFLCVSVFGLITMSVLAAYPPRNAEDTAWRRQFVGTIFALVCVLGIFAGLFPRKCMGLAGHTRSTPRSHTNKNGSDARVMIKGHHPDCEAFSNHLLFLKGHVVCAACMGLVFGGLIALVGTVLYFFCEWAFGFPVFLVVVCGQLGVVLGLVEFRFGGLIRSILNTFFVLGAFFILVQMDALAESLLVDLYLVGLIVVWILTRIMLSEWDHSRICRKCDFACGTKGKTGLVSAA